MPAPLAGYRVLELSRILAGPWAGQLFADLGAEVIKVERPIVGDDTRHWGPPFLDDQSGNSTGESAYFLGANSGKLSITVDISTPDGQAVINKLIAQSDVLVENYKVGGLKKYGLDYATLKERYPRLVYCSITGFGQDGPYAHKPGYDFLIQGMGGLMSITGAADGQPGAGPQKVGVALADILTGMYATVAIQAALLERQNSGLGQHIDLALLDVQVACLANQAMNFLVSGEAPSRLGNAHPNIVPYQSFATSDGHIILAVGNDGQFRKFCTVANCEELADDPRYETNANRVVNRVQLCKVLAGIIETRSMDWWLESLACAGVPSGPINTLDRVFDNPQVIARGMLGQVEHPLAGPVPTVANPIRFSRTPVVQRSASPLLGQHNDKLP